MDTKMTGGNHSTKRWPAEKVLRSARERIARYGNDFPARTQKMLGELCRESGWSESDFLNALCNDIMSRRRKPAT